MDTIEAEYSSGIEELNAIAGLPFATLQASFAWYYTELTLRYIGIPTIAGISVQLPGIGLRHDLREERRADAVHILRPEGTGRE